MGSEASGDGTAILTYLGAAHRRVQEFPWARSLDEKSEAMSTPFPFERNANAVETAQREIVEVALRLDAEGTISLENNQNAMV